MNNIITKRKSKILYSNSGITLVALVVTIIVLLILSSVGLSVTVGKNGILERARKIAEKTNEDQYNAQAELNMVGNNMAEGEWTNNSSDSANGTWNTNKNVNSPKLIRGMTPIKWQGNTEISTTTDDTEWYDYANQKWANAKTTDGSYWVWIPRYAYKITSGCNTSSVGNIEIKFLQGTSDKDALGNDISVNYPNVISNSMQDYVVHPAFITNVDNGGWNTEISGFWVAKYAAGFQACTTTETDASAVANSSDEIKYSTKKYTGSDGCTINAINQDLSNFSNCSISYPVFKPLTYAYNCIRVNDIYNICKEIESANNMYGISGVDSHLEKNSEWGAVAYLSQSSCGRNNIEIAINSKNISNSTKNVYGITAYADSTTPNGTSANTTNNRSGVFDLNGCVEEYVAGYIKNSNGNLTTYGNAFSEASNLAKSNKYVTVYPYNSSNDDGMSNYNQYNSQKALKYGYGDAILETSNLYGTGSWNDDYSQYPYENMPFILRAGYYGDSTSAGIFAFNNGSGNANVNCGFRAVLIGE